MAVRFIVIRCTLCAKEVRALRKDSLLETAGPEPVLKVPCPVCKATIEYGCDVDQWVALRQAGVLTLEEVVQQETAILEDDALLWHTFYTTQQNS